MSSQQQQAIDGKGVGFNTEVDFSKFPFPTVKNWQQLQFEPIRIRRITDEEIDDEIVWPPMVVVMNTRFEREETGRWNGIRSEELLDHFRSYSPVEARHSCGPLGHRGMSLLIFDSSAGGYLEAIRLHMDFVEQGRGRNSWDCDRDRVTVCPGKKCQLYGYMANKRDLYSFNEYYEGMTFELKSCKETVCSQVKELGEESKLTNFKNLHRKERKESLVRSEPPSIDDEKLSIAAENFILRSRAIVRRRQQKNKGLIKRPMKYFSDAWSDVDIAPYYSRQDDDSTVRKFYNLTDAYTAKIEADFKPLSFDVKFVYRTRRATYRAHILLLNTPILPEKCGVEVVPKGVFIILFKVSSKDWLNLPCDQYSEGKPVLLPTPELFPMHLSEVKMFNHFPCEVYRPGLNKYKDVTWSVSEKVLKCYNKKKHTNFRLVEMVSSVKMGFGAGAPWVIHVNFKAKRAHWDNDKEAVLFFGEVKDWFVVTACTVLNDTWETQNCCQICDPDDLIQHPVGGFDADCKSYINIHLPTFDLTRSWWPAVSSW